MSNATTWPSIWLANNTMTTDVNSSSLNATTLPPVQTRDENLARIEIAVQAVILFLAVFGNGMVLLVLALRGKKLSRMNLMIAHLSVADLFVAFFNVLPQMIWDITAKFYGGDFLCRSVKYFQVVAMYASSYVLVSTALDRWLVICHPLKSHTWSNKKLHGMVGIAWLLSLVFSIPQTTIFAFRELSPGVYDCWGEFHPMWTLNLYITWITVAIYIVPFLLLAGAYGRICFVVWRSMQAKEPSVRTKYPENGSLLKANNKSDGQSESTKREQNGVSSNPRAHVRGVSRAKVKTVKLTLTVIVCYLICWGPFFIAQMWAAWDPNAPFQGSTMVVIMLLASLNSCTNPWVYLAFSVDTCRILSRMRKAGVTATGNTYSDSRALRSTTEVSTLM